MLENKNSDTELQEEKQDSSVSDITYVRAGTSFPAVQVQIKNNKVIYCEAGAMSWMTPNVEMETNAKGIGNFFSRLLTGESAFINEFTALKGVGVIAFTQKLPGNIIVVNLVGNKPNIIAQKGSLLCAETGVETSIHFTVSLLRGIFGGEGFIMQKFSGNGTVFFEVDGSVVERELKEGEVMYVDQGNLAAYEETVQYKITTIKGILNWFFSGEGLYICKLTGPGKIWIQTLPSSQLRNKLQNAKKGPSIFGFIFSILLFLVLTVVLVGGLFILVLTYFVESGQVDPTSTIMVPKVRQ